MSTPYWGSDFDALAAFDPDIAGVVVDELDRLLIGTAIRDADGSRTADVAAGVRELVAAHPAYPAPARTA
jgi:hypothetical protein